MSAEKEKEGREIRQSRFPLSIFFMVFGTLLLMSGIHVGLVVWISRVNLPSLPATLIPLGYWGLVAGGVTLYTRSKIRRVYDVPMRNLAKAAGRVAKGDFSVFVPTLNTPDKYDYLDVMIMDFNTMVEELGSMETLKTDFFSNVSHEFKTPLAVVYNNAQLLDREEGLTEKQKGYIQSILKSSKRLGDMMGNMLKLNKLEKQTIKPAPESYDLCRQLADCALQFEEAWEKKGIEFEADIEERMPILADAGLLELVWMNLLSNAIKFTPEGGTVTLRQTADADRAVVTVEDTGCGMDEDTIGHIFDKFYQGDTSHSTEGTGLGLALVKRILQLSDGSISVESVQGKGSVFTVTLPLVPKESMGYLENKE